MSAARSRASARKRTDSGGSYAARPKPQTSEALFVAVGEETQQ